MYFKILINLKKSKFWYYFLLLILNPLYSLIWKNFFNFHGRILYFLWFAKKRNCINLKNESLYKIENNEFLVNFAKEINKACNKDFLNEAEKIIFNQSERNDTITGAQKKLIETDNVSNSNEKKYFLQIFDLLDEKIKNKIINFAKSEILVSTAAKYMGVFPMVSLVALTYHVPRSTDERRGAMLFHKDEKGYRSLDLFLSISDIDEDSGPFKALKTKYDELGPFALIDNSNFSAKKGNRDKIPDDLMNKKINNENLLMNTGKIGTGIFIDSFKHYHAGGHCLKKGRILLRILYATGDSTINSQNHNKVINLQKKNEQSNHFMKYLLFNKPIIFNNKFISNILLKFYRIAHFKF